MPSANRMTTAATIDADEIGGRYAASGQLPLVPAGTSIVAFSPSADLEATMAVVEKNLLSAGAKA